MSTLHPTAERLAAGRGIPHVETLTGSYTVPIGNSCTYLLDPGGASRAVTLPTAGEGLAGVELIIVNRADAAENLTVDTSLVTISQNETGRVLCVKTAASTYEWVCTGLAKAT